jgi:hypothetical protein
LAINQLKVLVNPVSNSDQLDELIDSTYEQEGFDKTLITVVHKLEKLSETSFVPARIILHFYEIIGDTNKRLYWLQKMYDTRDPALPYYGIKGNDPIQQEPAYIQIMKDINLW